MITNILPCNEQNVAMAAQLLVKGELVGIPTETVYGLAADATNDEAVKKIFIAKGRPQDNPLISHISDMDMLNMVVSEVTEDALKLAKAFWPGPLTMILPKSNLISKSVCAGLETAAVRMPSNEVARAIIKSAGVPLAAPSANLSGSPSPTQAKEVYDDMNGKIPLIIDDGACTVGVESTVVSLTGDKPIILRPGFITQNQMQDVLGKEVLISKAVVEHLQDGEKVLSPGMKYKHYSPKANVIIIKGSFENYCKYINQNKTDDTFALCFNGEEKLLSVKSIVYGACDDDAQQAQLLFTALRQLDAQGAKTVFARCPKNEGVGLAVYNRLLRAAAFQIIEV